jgi:hypothetical protein
MSGSFPSSHPATGHSLYGCARVKSMSLSAPHSDHWMGEDAEARHSALIPNTMSSFAADAKRLTAAHVLAVTLDETTGHGPSSVDSGPVAMDTDGKDPTPNPV